MLAARASTGAVTSKVADSSYRIYLLSIRNSCNTRLFNGGYLRMLAPGAPNIVTGFASWYMQSGLFGGGERLSLIHVLVL